MCLNGFDNEVTNSLKTSLLYDELFEAFHDLHDKLKKIDKIYSLLKMDHVSLANEFDSLKNKHDNYMSTSSISCTKYKYLESSNLELKKELFQNSLKLHTLKNMKNDLLSIYKKLKHCIEELC